MQYHAVRHDVAAQHHALREFYWPRYRKWVLADTDRIRRLLQRNEPGAEVLAQGDAAAVALWLAPFLGQPSSFPAVVATAHGDGRAVIYTFDLAASTVRFHQGRPEQASTGAYPDYDSDGMYKANDLFVGCLDERLLDLPQADLHQDLFVRALEWLAPHPLPRIWHFPGDAPAAALFDGDSDGMSRAQYEAAIAVADRHPISLDVCGLMPWFDAMLAYTADLPRFSDVDWVAFNDARRALRLEALDWDPERKTLTFSIRAGAAIDAATLVFAGAASSASVDGEPLPVTHREREGRQQSALVTDLPRAELRRFVVSWA